MSKHDANRRLCDSAPSCVGAVADALAISGVVSHIVGYLPWKQQLRSCRYVSRLWCEAAANRTEPITLHCEDRDELYGCCYPAEYQQMYKCRPTKTQWEDNHVPLWLAPRLPEFIIQRVVKMTFVARFAIEHANYYDLADYYSHDGQYNYFFGRFANLEDLAILSDFTTALLFFNYPEGFDHHNSPACQLVHPCLSLKKLVYYESAWPRTVERRRIWTHCDLQVFSKIAPNLEHLECPGNLTITGRLDSLLPLSNSLKVLNLNGCPVEGNVGDIIPKMHLLKAWDFTGTKIHPGDGPTMRAMAQHENQLRKRKSSRAGLDRRYTFVNRVGVILGMIYGYGDHSREKIVTGLTLEQSQPGHTAPPEPKYTGKFEKQISHPGGHDYDNDFCSTRMKRIRRNLQVMLLMKKGMKVKNWEKVNYQKLRQYFTPQRKALYLGIKYDNTICRFQLQDLHQHYRCERRKGPIRHVIKKLWKNNMTTCFLLESLKKVPT